MTTSPSVTSLRAWPCATAAEVDRAVDDYGRVETARAPESGDPRLVRLSQLGRLGGFVTAAWYEAERSGRGDDPDDSRPTPAQSGGQDQLSVWVALDRYESDAAVRASALGQPFVDETGAIKPDLSPDEAEALRHWAESLTVDGGLTATTDPPGHPGERRRHRLGDTPRWATLPLGTATPARRPGEPASRSARATVTPMRSMCWRTCSSPWGSGWSARKARTWSAREPGRGSSGCRPPVGRCCWPGTAP